MGGRPVRRSAVAVLVASTLTAGVCAVALAAPGDLDPTFGGDGIVTTNFTAAGSNFVSGVAIQADGKIVAAGGASDAFALARYNTDGSLDTSFDGDGKVTTDFAAGSDIAYDVAIQADGKIVAAGTASETWKAGAFALARYNTDGSLDTSFDGDGKVTTDFAADPDPDFASGVAIQADGKIVAAGTTDRRRFALARYNVDGSLDASFSGDGKQTTGFGIRSSLGYDLAIQADGKSVVVGYALASSGQNPGRFALARYKVDGTLDSTFSRDGKRTTSFATALRSSSAFAYAVAIQSNGKIVAAGTEDGRRFVLARYRTNGTLDSSFSRDGKVTTRVGKGSQGANGVAIQSTGRIVAVGVSYTLSGVGGARFALARYNRDGTLDSTFSGNGKVITDVAGGEDWASDVAIQANGRIVAAGRAGFTEDGNESRFAAILRYRGG